MTNDEKIRINKYLSSAGFGSRRKCEELVKEGRVKANGKTILDLGFMVQKMIKLQLMENLAQLRVKMFI